MKWNSEEAREPAPAPVEQSAAAPAAAPETVPPAAAPEPAVQKPAPAVRRPSPMAPKRTEPRPAQPAKKQEVASQAPVPAAPVTPPPPEAAPASQPAAPVEVPPPPPPPRQVTLQAGTLLSVRLVEALSSDRNQTGDTFTATLDQPLVADGLVIAERGARLEGRVVEAAQAGRVRGLSNLAIELTRLSTSDGQRVAISTETFQKQGTASKGKDAAKIGAAAGIGAAIGAIAGGGKGAGIGAAIGGAAGTGGVMATRGEPAVLHTETRISFRLKEAVTVTEQRK